MSSIDVIAETGARFNGFGPFVPSINGAGLVAFQAGLRDGRTGIFTSDGATLRSVGDSAVQSVEAFVSHPAINDAGDLAVFADLSPEGSALIACRGEAWEPLASSGAEFTGVGPLGPTINAEGMIAFRASTPALHSGLFVACDETIAMVADTRSVFSAFHGLPVLMETGDVLFRADVRRDGHAGIFLNSDGAIVPIAEQGDRFEELGRFPVANRAGTIVFVGTLRGGCPGVFASRNGSTELVIDARSGFESFRGALIDDSGRVIFYAVPNGGQLGIYALGADGSRRVTGVGDALAGTTVTEFALNPVSINARGQIAVRVALADTREMIARLDPFAGTPSAPQPQSPTG